MMPVISHLDYSLSKCTNIKITECIDIYRHSNDVRLVCNESLTQIPS